MTESKLKEELEIANKHIHTLSNSNAAMSTELNNALKKIHELSNHVIILNEKLKFYSI
jgi:hypothetical protein